MPSTSPARSTLCSHCGANVPVPQGERSAVRCQLCKAVTRVQQRTGGSIPDPSKQAVQRPEPQAMERPQQPHGRTTLCGRCGMYLSVPRGERSVCCALCHFVTRVQRRPSGLESFLMGLIYSLLSPPEPPASSSQDGLPASYPSMPGRKRALLVGISYTGTEHELKGPVNDVECMSYLLSKRFGFDSILVLTEVETDPNRVPTMKNLRLAMRWLVQGCDTGDALSLVFHFSGHAFDQALCPVDFQQGGGVIPDSQINEIIVRPLGPGVKLHAFVDADQSGNVVLDLPYLCRISRTGFWQWENQNRQPETPKGTNGGLAISISGFKDSQNSATISGNGSSVGAMTYHLINALESEPGTTYGRLIQAIRAKIRRQEPQLRTSEAFDIYRKPFLL